MPVPELHATSPKWQAGSRQLAGAGPVHTRVLPVASQSAGTAVRLLLPLKVTARPASSKSVLTLAEGLLAAPAQAGTPPLISVATAQDVSPLGLAWRGPPGLPSVSLSEPQ